MKKWFIHLLLGFFLIPSTIMAQKGTVKIFSEIKPVKVYLNEEFKGTDVVTLDSVAAGSHYLKVTKDEVIVYGELITVKAGEVTTILIKDSKENRDKQLQAKFKEIQEYKAKRLDVLMSTNYVTSTSGVTKSTYYPGYYVASGVSRSNVSSTTTAVTDWFVAQGGVKKLSEVDFARMVNNQDALTRYEADRSRYRKDVKSSERTGCIGGGVLLATGATLLVMSITSDDKDAKTTYLVLSVLSTLLSLGFTNISNNAGNDYKWQSHYMTVDDAVKYANQYNQDLKKRLGLPEDFEPEGQ